MGVDQVPVYILAGGRSSRFGSDKALAEIDGECLIKRVCRLLSPFASSTTVVADKPDKYTDFGLRTIQDLNPGLGPLAGLQAALHDMPKSEHWLLLCSCDAYVIRHNWIERLLAHRTKQCQAVAYRTDRWQPVPAVYSRSCLPSVESQIKRNDLSMQRLLDRQDVYELQPHDDWPDNWQINTVKDLERLRESGEVSRPSTDGGAP